MSAPRVLAQWKRPIVYWARGATRPARGASPGGRGPAREACVFKGGGVSDACWKSRELPKFVADAKDHNTTRRARESCVASFLTVTLDLLFEKIFQKTWMLRKVHATRPSSCKIARKPSRRCWRDSARARRSCCAASGGSRLTGWDTASRSSSPSRWRDATNARGTASNRSIWDSRRCASTSPTARPIRRWAKWRRSAPRWSTSTRCSSFWTSTTRFLPRSSAAFRHRRSPTRTRPILSRHTPPIRPMKGVSWALKTKSCWTSQRGLIATDEILWSSPKRSFMWLLENPDYGTWLLVWWFVTGPRWSRNQQLCCKQTWTLVNFTGAALLTRQAAVWDAVA